MQSTTVSLDSSNILLPSFSLDTTSLKNIYSKAIETAELEIHEKYATIVHRKLADKIKDLNIEKEVLVTLETDLLADLEDTIQTEIENLKKNSAAMIQPVEESNPEDSYETKGFYWDGEDCCEMIWYDETWYSYIWL